MRAGGERNEVSTKTLPSVTTASAIQMRMFLRTARLVIGSSEVSLDFGVRAVTTAAPGENVACGGITRFARGDADGALVPEVEPCDIADEVPRCAAKGGAVRDDLMDDS